MAPYRDADGKIVAQKVRGSDKRFTTTGAFDEVVLFGQHLWKEGGRRIAVTEGEIDAMALNQALGGTWPVVSIPNGSNGARKALAKNLEFLESFEHVVLFFDMDEAGEKAVAECADLFTPGKCCVASIPLKDAGEMVEQGRIKELVSAFWNAQVRRPDGIVNLADTWEQVSEDVAMGTPYPMECLNTMLYGLRPEEIVTVAAGSGIGKSALAAEVAYHLAVPIGDPIGYIALEEGTRRTGLRFMGLHLNKPIHLPGFSVDKETKRKAFEETLGTGRIWSYDHFGSLESDRLLNKMHYLVKGCGVKWLFLDHISIVISGSEDDDERKALDRIMTKLRTFTERTKAGLVLVSHLKRPTGTGHEEGGLTSLSQLRGSGAIGQLSDIVIGLERNQQADNAEERNLTTVRVLKNRYAGDTGVAGVLEYHKDTGRLTEGTPFDGEPDGDDRPKDF